MTKMTFRNLRTGVVASILEKNFRFMSLVWSPVEAAVGHEVE